MMVIFKVLLFFAFTVYSSQALSRKEELLKEYDEKKLSEMYNCLQYIVCTLERLDEIREAMEEAGPILLEKAFKWHGDCFDMKYTNEEEFFRDLIPYLCPTPEEQKRRCIKEFAIEYEKYYDENCVNPEERDKLECEGAENMLISLGKKIEEHMLNGDCSNPEKVAEAVKETAGKSPHKPFTKPNFG